MWYIHNTNIYMFIWCVIVQHAPNFSTLDSLAMVSYPLFWIAIGCCPKLLGYDTGMINSSNVKFSELQLRNMKFLPGTRRTTHTKMTQFVMPCNTIVLLCFWPHMLFYYYGYCIAFPLYICLMEQWNEASALRGMGHGWCKKGLIFCSTTCLCSCVFRIAGSDRDGSYALVAYKVHNVRPTIHRYIRIYVYMVCVLSLSGS